MINFKKYYVNGRGGMFWNTLMLFFNKLQESKEQYHKKKLESTKEDFYKVGQELGIKINDLQRLRLTLKK